jgi:hypothetical protein
LRRCPRRRLSLQVDAFVLDNGYLQCKAMLDPCQIHIFSPASLVCFPNKRAGYGDTVKYCVGESGSLQCLCMNNQRVSTSQHLQNNRRLLWHMDLSFDWPRSEKCTRRRQSLCHCIGLRVSVTLEGSKLTMTANHSDSSKLKLHIEKLFTPTSLHTCHVAYTSARSDVRASRTPQPEPATLVLTGNPPPFDGYKRQTGSSLTPSPPHSSKLLFTPNPFRAITINHPLLRSVSATRTRLAICV